MSHVDEGQLHAYLDGGLSAMDAVRVERHLAECAACRMRLEEARALVQRAARLLEWASPPERAAPPLSDLQPTAPRWRTPLAWAATIVVALGVGIYAGPRVFRAGTNEQAAHAAPQSRDAERAVGTLAAPAPADSVHRQEKDSQPRAVSEVAVDTPRDRRAMAQNAAPAAPAPAPVAITPPRLLDSVGRATVDSVRPLADAAAPRLERQMAPVAAAQPSAVLAPAADSASLGRRDRSLVPTWPIVSRDSASRLLGSSLVALPDLPITNVRATNDAVVVEHVVPPGQVIRLVERRATDEALRTPAGNELLARYVGGLRVEISGPFSADSLSRLLEKVRVVP